MSAVRSVKAGRPYVYQEDQPDAKKKQKRRHHFLFLNLEGGMGRVFTKMCFLSVCANVQIYTLHRYSPLYPEYMAFIIFI